ncbi:MAG: hypothetical protein ACOYEL_06940 [Saccharofermentanales bacterium]|jgi:hypothetical protein
MIGIIEMIGSNHHVIEYVSHCILPAILAYFDSEEGYWSLSDRREIKRAVRNRLCNMQKAND